MDENTIEILIASNTTSTLKQYNSVLRYWWDFCQKHGHDPFATEDIVILRCLTKKFEEDAAYGTLNTLKSAIALINNRHMR